jgi:hypothetical protein
MTTLDLELIGRPSDSVREIETHDGAVLLDIEERICVALTPVAVKIWRLLKSSLSPDEIVDQLAIEYNVPRQELDEDTSAFLRSLFLNGLLKRHAAARKHKLRNVSSLLFRSLDVGFQNHVSGNLNTARLLFSRAFVALLLCDVLRLSHNFAAMHEFVRRWPKAQRAPLPEATRLVHRAVAYACVWYPKRVLCLQRSAVVTCLLRGCGVPAEMVMGAQAIPFKAHAWTEVEGRPIHEPTDVRKIYLVWERC